MSDAVRLSLGVLLFTCVGSVVWYYVGMESQESSRTCRGMRVFTPDEHQSLARVLNGWVRAAEWYGFRQYKTSVLDPIEIYEGKTSQEILDEQIYSFKDRKGRDIVLRPEMTPGVCVMIANLQKNRQIKKPYKVFSIGSVFRYEKPQRGRQREHIQYNVDIFGSDSLWADAEVIEVAIESLVAIGFKYNDFVVRVNDRQALESTLRSSGVADSHIPDVLRILDRRDKITKEEFREQLASINETLPDTIDSISSKEPDSIKELKMLLPNEIPVQYDSSIVRGFDYYTGVVFEIYTTDKSIKRSIAGGGRYDTLVEKYSLSPISAVGFGMGDVGILDLMGTLNNTEQSTKRKSIAVYVTDTKYTERALEVARTLRDSINKHTIVSFIGAVNQKKLYDMYKRMEEMGVLYAVGVADDFDLRNLETRTSDTLKDTKEIIKTLNNNI